jgi:hypothetical protein
MSRLLVFGMVAHVLRVKYRSIYTACFLKFTYTGCFVQNPNLLIFESRKPAVSSRVQKLFRQIQRQIHAAEIHDLRRTALSPTADYSGFRNTVLPGPSGEQSGFRNTGPSLLKADRSGFQRTVLPLDSSMSPAKHVSQIQVKRSFVHLNFFCFQRLERQEKSQNDRTAGKPGKLE